jgi:hypothetical protein
MSKPSADFNVTQEKHAYEIRSRKDKRGVDPISNALPSIGCGTATRMQSRTQSTTQKVMAHRTML